MKKLARKVYRGKQSKASLENGHTSKKSPVQQGWLLGNPWAIQKKESFFHVMAQLAAEMGLVQHPRAPPADVAESEEFIAE